MVGEAVRGGDEVVRGGLIACGLKYICGRVGERLSISAGLEREVDIASEVDAHREIW